MEELVVQDIYIYPVKSLGGISLQQAEVQQTGLQHDRRWMLTDEKYKFLSLRTHPEMVFLQTGFSSNSLLITHKKNFLPPLEIPLNASLKKEVTVTIWEDECIAFEVSTPANRWFSEILNMPVKLVYMPATTQRHVDADFAEKGEIVSFADAFPLMIIGQSSLDDLNSRLSCPLPMERFRPNIVFTGGAPYFEDIMSEFTINGINFNVAKPCIRCVVTTIDTVLATRGKEPLKTLSTYRSSKNKILFGQNLLHSGFGSIKVGDRLIVSELKKSAF